VLRTHKGKTLVRDDDGKETWVENGQVLKNMHISSQRAVEDMIVLLTFYNCLSIVIIIIILF
jgi:hypothetical protein